MFAKLKSPVFIDSVVFEFSDPMEKSIRAVLKDEYGKVQSHLDTNIPDGLKVYRWSGLNDLPYGVYTLEYSQGEDEQHVQRMIKRV
jgi:hypothetical protein